MSIQITKKAIAFAIASATLASCSTTQQQSSTSSSNNTTTSAYSSDELVARNESLLAREAELARREAELLEAEASAEGDLLPPDGQPGECYARVWVEPTYNEFTENVLKKEASSRIEIIPAQYTTVTETVLVSEASSRLETIPATYKTVSEQKLVSEGGLQWKLSLDQNAGPASNELLETAAHYGIDLDSADPGMCYHEHFVAAKFEEVYDQVLVREAYDVLAVEEAQYRWVEKEVLVSEASSRLEEIPAVYETVTEQVVDVPAHTVWKKGTGPIQRIDEATGEIMCLVEIPATYKTVTKEVLVSPATTREIEIPAVYETVRVRELATDAQEVRNTVPAEYRDVAVTKKVADPTFVWHEVHDTTMNKDSRTGNQICLTEEQPRYETVTTTVVDIPAETREIEIPAEYQTLEVRKVVSAAKENVIEIPAVYETVNLREVENEGFMEWRSILCETNMNVATITGIQRALANQGYNPGPIDGVIGQETITAVNAFQTANSLPVDEYINMETIEALGVEL